jgi:uncharacterized protein YigA (DUF484 family)
MTPEEVAQFLRMHPDFFAQHPKLLESIYVPHPHGGRAIPLTERQLVTLRDKARQLEGKLSELIQFGEDNDAISERVHRLSLALLGSHDFGAVANAINFHLREDFAVPHVELRVWDQGHAEGGAVPASVDPALRDQATNLGAPFCGPATSNAFASLFGEAKDHVRSIAVIPLGATKVIGLLALGSEDAQRFYADMGTLYLRRIGELTAGALAARS